MPCGEVSPESLVGKENSGHNQLFSTLRVLLWEPVLGSYTMEAAGKSKAFKHWEPDCRGDLLTTTSAGILAGQVHTNQWFCSSSDPSEGYALTRELRSTQICLIWTLKQGSSNLCSMPRQEAESQPHSLWRAPSRPI